MPKKKKRIRKKRKGWFHPENKELPYDPEFDGSARSFPRKDWRVWRQFFSIVDWKDSDPPFKWLKTCRRLATQYGCVLRLDVKRNWQESRYFPAWFDDNGKERPTLLVGGAGDPNCVCTTLLHELGHHILYSRNIIPVEEMTEEMMAWETAKDLARKHRLPFVNRARRFSLHSHKTNIQSEENAGSKRNARRRPKPRSWSLTETKRSATTPTPKEPEPVGKKGKRLQKRLLKRLTHKAERRAGIPEE